VGVAEEVGAVVEEGLGVCAWMAAQRMRVRRM